MAINKSERDLVNEFLAQAQPVAGGLDDRIAQRKAARAEARRSQRITRSGRWANPAAVEPVIGPQMPPPGQPGPGRIASGPMSGPGPRPFTMPNPARSTSLAPTGGSSIQRQLASQLVVPDEVIPPGQRAIPAGAQKVQATYARPTATSTAPASGGARAVGGGARALGSAADDLTVAAARQATGGGIPRGSTTGIIRGAAKTAAGAADDAAKAGGMWNRYGKFLGSKGNLLRFGGPAVAGLGAGMLLDQVWDDPNSRVDDGVKGALQGALAGSAFGPWGAAIGGLGFGALGLLGDDGPTDSERIDATRQKFDDVLAEYNVSPRVQDQLLTELGIAAEFAQSPEEVDAIYRQGAALLPQLMEQDRLEQEQLTRRAALEAAILPLLEQQSQAYIGSASDSLSASLVAADSMQNPEVANLMRARARQQYDQANQFALASTSQIGAAPFFADAFGVQPQFTVANGSPATDLSGLLQQQLATLTTGS